MLIAAHPCGSRGFGTCADALEIDFERLELARVLLGVNSASFVQRPN